MKHHIGSAIAAALALATTHAGAAYADDSATSFDMAAAAVHQGNGSGDLVLALVAGSGTVLEVLRGGDSLVWDLSGNIPGHPDKGDLTFNDIMALSQAGVSFSISNPEVGTFLSSRMSQPDARVLWQVFGVVDIGSADGDDLVTGNWSQDVGFVMTINGDVAPVSGGNLAIQLQSNAQWLSDNVEAGLPGNGVLVASPGQPHSFDSSLGEHGEIIAMQDATGKGLDVALAFYYLQKDPSQPDYQPLLDPNFGVVPGSNEMDAIARQLGSFRLAADGTLTFTALTAVPAPPAVWMLGSGLLALAGIGRRRR